MPRRIQSLDGLRGLAVLTIVLNHFLLTFPSFHGVYIENQDPLGWMKGMALSPLFMVWNARIGVLILFILSGYFLGRSFGAYRERPYGIYIVRRFIRLYLPYIVIMLASGWMATACLELPRPEGLSPTFYNRWSQPVTGETLKGYFLMFQIDTTANGVVWQIYQEMRLAFVLPFALLLLRHQGLFRSLLVIVPLWYGSLKGLEHCFDLASDDFLRLVLVNLHLTVKCFPYAALGAMMGFYEEKLQRNLGPYPAVGGVSFLLGLLFLNYQLPAYFFDLDLLPWQKDAFLAVGLLLLIVALGQWAGRETVFSHPRLTALGRISFMIFMLHIPLMMLMTLFLAPWIGYLPANLLAFVLLIPLGKLAQRLIEDPVAKLTGRIG